MEGSKIPEKKQETLLNPPPLPADLPLETVKEYEKIMNE